jgi:CIC family chloride channel protein
MNLAARAVNWIHEKLTEKQFLIFSSILVGVTAGMAAVILKLFVHFIRKYAFSETILNEHTRYLILAMPMIGIAITVIIIDKFFKGKLSKGIDNILFAIAKKSSIIPRSQMFSHVVSSGITIGFGGSSGLESPIVHTGSAIGSNYARKYKMSYKERTLLLAAGAAGGIAGAFNAPIAGILFALEVLLVDINITAFIPLLIASASGALISKIILKEDVLLLFKLKREFDYYNVPFYIAIGLIAGVISLYHMKAFNKTNVLMKRISKKWVRVFIAGTILAVLVGVFPSLFGEGYESIKMLADMQLSGVYKNGIFGAVSHDRWLFLTFILLTIIFKPIAVGATLGGGGNGGNFAPALFSGAYVGFAFAFLMISFGFTNIPVTNFVLVSMAGTLCGVFYAPLTAIFLIAEITGGYELIIPLMIVSSISFSIVKYFQPDSHAVKKLKKRGTVISEDKDTSILGKIEMISLIEKDFVIISPEEKLRSVIEKIKESKRNVFPVVNKEERLIGIITLDHIKKEMFNHELYDSVIARELMEKPETKIRMSDDIFAVMNKFEESGQWNLPVTDHGKYVGFLSKSGILNRYRTELLESV